MKAFCHKCTILTAVCILALRQSHAAAWVCVWSWSYKCMCLSMRQKLGCATYCAVSCNTFCMPAFVRRDKRVPCLKTKLAIWGGISGSGWCDHGDEAHALFSLWSVAGHHKNGSKSCLVTWKVVTLIATILYLPGSGESCQLFSSGGAICKILSSLLTAVVLLCVILYQYREK